jgi:D-arabinose 1-dehydrogenase-like Zn-dependent alcohol dehydrogenase
VVSIFDLVLNRYTLRGSIVGTRKDLEEPLAFAADGKVKATIETQALESINSVFEASSKERSTVALFSTSFRKPASNPRVPLRATDHLP